MKKILIIHTGGTFGMSPMDPYKTLKPGNILKDIQAYLPILNQIADIKVYVAFNLDSSNIGPKQWIILHDLLKKEMSNYDGFVIIHGTDTIIYTATFLSFLFTSLDKPIIFTGSQRPLSEIRTDARTNLICAVELATYDIPEVAICFGNKLFRSNRTKKVSIESFHSFDSPNYPPLATIGLSIHIENQRILTRTLSFKLKPKVEQSIFVITMFPGLEPGQYAPIINSDIRCIILQGFGAGNLPHRDINWIPFINQAVDRDIMVFICSLSPHGMVDLDLYNCGKEAKKAGAISLADMTVEAAITKLMLLLANFKNNKTVKKYMLTNIAGELAE